MPLYVYKHPKTNKTVEVVQTMRENHVYIDEAGTQWERVFVPLASVIDANIDPNDARAFVRKTDKKGMTLGDMWDYSGDLSRKREKQYGKDPVKEKATKDYEKKTRKKHPLI